MRVQISGNVRKEFARMTEFTKETSFETSGFLTGHNDFNHVSLEGVVLPQRVMYTFPTPYTLDERTDYKGNDVAISPGSVEYSPQFMRRVVALKPIGYAHTHPTDDEPFPSPQDLAFCAKFLELGEQRYPVQVTINSKGDFYVARIPWITAITTVLTPVDKKELEQYIVYRSY